MSVLRRFLGKMEKTTNAEVKAMKNNSQKSQVAPIHRSSERRKRRDFPHRSLPNVFFASKKKLVGFEKRLGAAESPNGDAQRQVAEKETQDQTRQTFLDCHMLLFRKQMHLAFLFKGELQWQKLDTKAHRHGRARKYSCSRW